MIGAVCNLATLAAGMVLLSSQFGWKVGVGIGCLVYFHKLTELA